MIRNSYILGATGYISKAYESSNELNFENSLDLVFIEESVISFIEPLEIGFSSNLDIVHIEEI